MYLDHPLIILLQLLYVITVVGVLFVVISENRNPIKTIAWILAVIFLPVIGIFWYLVFGQEFARKHLVSRRMDNKLKKRPLEEMNTEEELLYPPQHRNLINLLRNMNQSQLLGGNSVEFFTTGSAKFDRLFQDLENAKHHIHLEYYILEEDELGYKLQQTLIRKAKEGVQIRIIYDSFGARNVRRRYFEEYRKNGIEIKPFLKLALPTLTSRLNYRNHRKIVVIDGKIGYVGGMNFSDRYVKGLPWGIWRDTHIRIVGKGVQGLQSVFLIDWYFVSRTLLTDHIFFPKLENFGNNPMQIVNSGPFREQRDITHGISQALYGAQTSVYIQTPYFLPPDDMCQALQAAAIRGVDVRVMITKRSDINFVQMASMSYIKAMLHAGVKIFFYTKGFLHSKLMVFDDTLTLIGSANFDARSFDQNFEVEAFVYDKNTATQARQIFEEDMKDCQQVSLKEWLKRPRSKRFLESLMRLFAPLW